MHAGSPCCWDCGMTEQGNGYTDENSHGLCTACGTEQGLPAYLVCGTPMPSNLTDYRGRSTYRQAKHSAHVQTSFLTHHKAIVPLVLRTFTQASILLCCA